MLIKLISVDLLFQYFVLKKVLTYQRYQTIRRYTVPCGRIECKVTFVTVRFETS
jgi:hypothetical protein